MLRHSKNASIQRSKNFATQVFKDSSANEIPPSGLNENFEARRSMIAKASPSNFSYLSERTFQGFELFLGS